MPKATPIDAVSTPFSWSWSGTSRLTLLPIRPPSVISTSAATIRRSAPARRRTLSTGLPDGAAWPLPDDSTARPTASAALMAAEMKNGAPSPNRSTSTPANAGPATPPKPAVVTVSESACASRSPTASLSQAIPVVHSTPNPAPKSVRAATSTQKLPASPCPRSATAITTTAAIVNRRAPIRSTTIPAGIETSRIARLVEASSSPASNVERWNRLENAGTSGTIALHITSPTNSAMYSSRTTGRRIAGSIAGGNRSCSDGEEHACSDQERDLVSIL